MLKFYILNQLIIDDNGKEKKILIDVYNTKKEAKNTKEKLSYYGIFEVNEYLSF